jgi:hypothetical protein
MIFVSLQCFGNVTPSYFIALMGNSDLFCEISLYEFTPGLIEYHWVRLTSQNRGHHWPIVHPPGECEWRAVVMMIPAGDNSCLVFQSSLAVYQQRHLEQVGGMDEGMKILLIQHL